MPLLLELLAPQKNDVILDVGAGTGVYAAEMTKYCDEVFALDPDPRKIDYIKRKYPEVKAFDGAAEAIQFPESYFTKIYALNSVHHFKDQDSAFYEFDRVLKSAGILIIRDLEPEARRSRLESRSTKNKVVFVSSEELKEKLELAGFEIRDIRKSGSFYILSSRKI